MGRPPGTCNISPEKIEKIIELTEKGVSRIEISREIKCAKSTVFFYQRRFSLI